MLKIYAAGNQVAEYPRQLGATVEDFCRSKNVSFRCTRNGDYVLYPALLGQSVCLHNLSSQNEISKTVVNRLSAGLQEQGAHTYYLAPSSSWSEFIRHQPIRAVLAFACPERAEDKTYLSFFSSNRHKEECILLTFALIKQLGQSTENIPCKIASWAEKIINLRYWSLFRCKIPLLLCELQNIAAPQAECLADSILTCLLAEWGDGGTEEQWQNLRELQNTLATAVDKMTREVQISPETETHQDALNSHQETEEHQESLNSQETEEHQEPLNSKETEEYQEPLNSKETEEYQESLNSKGAETNHGTQESQEVQEHQELLVTLNVAEKKPIKNIPAIPSAPIARNSKKKKHHISVFHPPGAEAVFSFAPRPIIELPPKPWLRAQQDAPNLSLSKFDPPNAFNEFRNLAGRIREKP